MSKEIKPNIHMPEDGKHTDFVLELTVTYNGETKSIKYDYGEHCDENGKMTGADFDLGIHSLAAPLLAWFIHYKKIISDSKPDLTLTSGENHTHTYPISKCLKCQIDKG